MGLGDFMWDLGVFGGTWGLYVGLRDFMWDLGVFGGTWGLWWDLGGTWG